MSSIYIHIPFCSRICSYCDFPKRVSKSTQIDKYLLALEKEVNMYDVKDCIDTLYIGGGTPSILNNNQLDILKKIISKFTFSNNYEFTIECNPEHITLEKINYYKELGVNRISLGVQSFNDRLLKLLNRGHNKEIVYNAINLLKNNGIKNISIDLMYAIPFQTLDDVKYDIQNIKKLDLTHVSAYSLILEEKTVFEKMLDEKKINLVDNDIEAQMYELYISLLKEMDFNHYEISNYAKKGYESKHNKIYWENKEYYGFGMGASGYINQTRYYNENMVNNYIKKIYNNEFPIMGKDIISISDKIKEEFLLGLRLLEGISIQNVNKKYGIDVLKYFSKEFTYLKEKNWITIDSNIKLTHKGLLYGNDVFEMFI